MRKLNSFESVAPGATLTVSNTDDISGIPFDHVTTTGDGTIVGTNERSSHGAIAAKCVVTSSGRAYVAYNASYDEVRARAYCYIEALPVSGFFDVINFIGTDSLELGAIYLTSGQQVKIHWPGNFGNSTTFKYPLNRWFRLEARCKVSTGEIEVRLYAGAKLKYYGQTFGGMEAHLLNNVGFGTGDSLATQIVPDLKPPKGACFQALCVTSDGMMFISNPSQTPNTVSFFSAYGGQTVTVYDTNTGTVSYIHSKTSGGMNKLGYGAPIWQTVVGFIDGIETVVGNTVNVDGNHDLVEYGEWPAYQLIRRQDGTGEWKLVHSMMPTYTELNGASSEGAYVFPLGTNSLGQSYAPSKGWSEVDILPYSGCIAGSCYFPLADKFTGTLFVIDPRFPKVTAYYQPPDYVKDTRAVSTAVDLGGNSVKFTLSTAPPAGVTPNKTNIKVTGASPGGYNVSRALVTAISGNDITVTMPSPGIGYTSGATMGFMYELCPLGLKAWGTSDTDEYFSVRFDTFGYTGASARPFPCQIMKYNSVTKALTAATPIFFIDNSALGANVGGAFTDNGDFIQSALTNGLQTDVAYFGRTGGAWPALVGADFMNATPDTLLHTSLGFGVGRPVWDSVTQCMFISTGSYIIFVHVTGSGPGATVTFTTSKKVWSPHSNFLAGVDSATLSLGLPWLDKATRRYWFPVLAVTNNTTDAAFGPEPYQLHDWVGCIEVDELCGPVTTEMRGAQLSRTADKAVHDDLAYNVGIAGWSGKPIGKTEFGETNGFTSAGTLYIDEVGATDGAWLGPSGKRVVEFYLTSPSLIIGNIVTAYVQLDAIYDSDTPVILIPGDAAVVIPESVTVYAGTDHATFAVRGARTYHRVATHIQVYTSPEGYLQEGITIVPTPPPPTHLPQNPYRVVIEDLHDSPIDEVPAKQLQYSRVLNASGQCTFTLPVTHPKSTEEILKEGARQVILYRNGIRVWGGYLWKVDASQKDLRVSCGGWLSRLALRYINTDRVYASEDQFNIAWDILTYTQSKMYGNLGIVQYPTGTSGILRDIAYIGTQFTPVLQALSDLAAMEDGFDYEVTPDKLWTPYYPKKGQNNGLVFDLQKNILGLSWTRDAENMANEISAVGSSAGSSPLISVQGDASLRSTYGLLEVSTSWTDVTAQPNLDAHALSDLAVMKISRDDPQMSVTVEDPPFGSFAVGDVVHISAHYGFMQIEQDYRIITMEDAINDEGRDVMTLTFDTQVS